MGFSVKGFVKGAVNTAFGAATGDYKKVAKGFQQGLGMDKSGKAGSVSDTAEQSLIKEQEESRKKRARLFATAGGARGEEVEAVGLAGDVRGSIFGNKGV